MQTITRGWFLILVGLSAPVMAVDMDQLRGILREQRDRQAKITSGRISYIEIGQSAQALLEGGDSEPSETVAIANMLVRYHSQKEVIMVFNTAQNILRLTTRDNRDLEDIWAHQRGVLEDSQRDLFLVNLDQTSTRIYQNNHMLDYKYCDPNLVDDVNIVTLVEGSWHDPDPFGKVRTGAMLDYWVNQGPAPESQVNYQVAEATWQGQPMILLTKMGISEKNISWKINVYLDPVVDYGFRRVEYYHFDILVQEETADEYLENPILRLPGVYCVKRYSADGKVLESEKTIIIESAEFNMIIDPDAFTIKVPAGAYIHNYSDVGEKIEGMKMYQTTGPETISIDSIIKR